jgi:hypothetical protein
MTAAMWTLPNVLTGLRLLAVPFLGAALVVAGDTPEGGLDYGVKASALVRAASPVHHGGTPAAVQPFDGATPLFLSGLGRQQGGGGASSRVRS